MKFHLQSSRGLTIGRPELANPVFEERSRRFIDAVDELRKKQGLPPVRADQVVFQEAHDLLADPSRRELLIAKVLAGQELTDTETVAARQIISDTLLNLRNAGQKQMLEAAKLVNGWRWTGTEQARAFRHRRDWWKTPGQRMAEYIGHALLTPPKRLRVEKDQPAAKLEEVLKQWLEQVPRIKEKLKKRGIDLDNLTKEQLSDRPTVAHIVREIQIAKADLGNKLYEFWINAILSAPLTHAANLIGNATSLAIEGLVSRPIQATMNLLAKDPDSPQWSELLPVVRAAPRALHAAWRNMAESFRTEAPTFEMKLSPETDVRDKLEGIHAAIGGKTGRVIRVPGRALRASDEFFKTLVGHMEAAAHAHRIAQAEGLSGDAMEKRMIELTDDYESPAWVGALVEAKRLTFQAELGPLGKWFLKSRGLPGAGWVSRYTVPFVTTMANIFKEGLGKTPLSSPKYLYRVLRQADAARRGRPMPYPTRFLLAKSADQLIAWGIVAFAFAATGDEEDEPWLTGTVPWKGTSRKERDFAWRTAPPMSIRFPWSDTWYSYGRIEPLATMLATTVDGVSAVKRHQRGESASAAYGRLWQQMAAQVKEKTFAKGITDMLDAFEDGDAAAGWIGNFATSWVPNVVRSPARASDEFIREKPDWVSKSLPIAALAPPPKVDPWGQDIRKHQGKHPLTDWLYRVLVPINQQKVDPNRLDRLILNYNNAHPGEEFYPVAPSAYLSENGQRRQMTPEEYHDFLRDSGRAAYEELTSGRLDLPPLDPANPTEADIKAIEKVMDQKRREARNRMKEAMLPGK